MPQFTLTTPAAIVLASVILGASHLGYGIVAGGSGNATQILPSFMGKAISSDEHVEGVNKKVFIVEYSDTECPYCVSFHNTVKQLREEYKDKVGYVYRFFPLTSIHPHAQKEAEAIACAGKLGGKDAYFSLMTAMFDYKVANNTNQLPQGIEAVATSVGLDGKAITSCVNNSESADLVNQSVNDGITAGVSGTPTTFILAKDKTGFKVVASVEGGRDYTFMKQAVEQALAATK